MGSKKYEKNFLKGVIIRVDLAQPISELKHTFPASLKKELLKIFPIQESKQIFGQEFQISPSKNLKEKKIEMSEWYFHGKEKEKTLCITNRFLFMEVRDYRGFTSFLEDFKKIITLLFEEYPETVTGRLGLRYINEIEITDKTNPFKWDKFINKSLLGEYGFIDKKTEISRVFSAIDYNLQNFFLKFQYGMYNPDFPAPIKRKVFVLDYDAYEYTQAQADQMITQIKNFHSKIQELFESSITDTFRKKFLGERNE